MSLLMYSVYLSMVVIKNSTDVATTALLLVLTLLSGMSIRGQSLYSFLVMTS